MIQKIFYGRPNFGLGDFSLGGCCTTGHREIVRDHMHHIHQLIGHQETRLDEIMRIFEKGIQSVAEVYEKSGNTNQSIAPCIPEWKTNTPVTWNHYGTESESPKK